MRRFVPFLLFAALAGAAETRVERHAVFEAEFQASSVPANPYTAIAAEAAFSRPGGGTWKVPLFWDGGKTWKARVTR